MKKLSRNPAELLHLPSNTDSLPSIHLSSIMSGGAPETFLKSGNSMPRMMRGIGGLSHTSSKLKV